MEKTIERTSPMILMIPADFQAKYMAFCQSLGSTPEEIFTDFMKEAIKNIGGMNINFSEIR